MQQMQQVIQELQQKVADKQADLDNKVEVKRMDSATQLIVQYLQGEQAKAATHQQSMINATQKGFDHAHNLKAIGSKNEAQSKSKTSDQSPTPQPTPQVAKAGETAQQDQVDQQLGNFAETFIAQMLPALMQGQGGQPPAAQPQAAAPPQPQGPDPMAAMQQQLQQNSQAMMSMMQVVSQAIGQNAEALKALAAAQMTPKKAQKGADGSITLVPVLQ
jgi:hypothetical protein